MTARPWSPVEVEVKLESGLDQLDDVMTGYLGIADDAATAKQAYDLACARKMLELRISNPKLPKHVLDAEITVACHEERAERDACVAAEEAARKALDSYKTRIEALRTLLVQSRPQAAR